MAEFRIEKSSGYTVMSNHHLRNSGLSLKAKGLLSQMLSLPDNWDYTLAGLASINQEGKDAIRAAVRELEEAGYIVRRQTRDENGKLAGNEYIIRETPVSPLSENPTTDNPSTEKPSTENPTEINKDKSNKDLLKKSKKEKPGELSMDEIKQLIQPWVARMDPNGTVPDLRGLLVEWYSPRPIKKGGPPVKSLRGVNGLLSKLETDCQGQPYWMAWELDHAIASGWSGIHPRKYPPTPPPENQDEGEGTIWL